MANSSWANHFRKAGMKTFRVDTEICARSSRSTMSHPLPRYDRAARTLSNRGAQLGPGHARAQALAACHPT